MIYLNAILFELEELRSDQEPLGFAEDDGEDNPDRAELAQDSALLLLGAARATLGVAGGGLVVGHNGKPEHS